MDFFKDIADTFADLFNPISRAELSDFQKKKMIHEFKTFYDRNKDGSLQWKDFEMAREHICGLSGWKPGSMKSAKCHELFVEMWRNLSDLSDSDCDGNISQEEWLKMWTGIHRAKLTSDRAKEKAGRSKKTESEKKNEDEDATVEAEHALDDYMPKWFDKYIQYKFNLYDRTGDGAVDADEFEYTLVDGFNMNSKDARAAFTMFSQGGEKKVDMAYFRELAVEFYLSNDPGALGNFINGKLTYD